jgi:HSP20 family protein
MAQEPKRESKPEQGHEGRAESTRALTRPGSVAMSWPRFSGLSPWAGSPLRWMFHDADRLFDAMQRTFWGGERGEGTWIPAIDVRDADNEIVIEAEIPGVDPDDVHVECREDSLIIRGQSEEQKTEERRTSRRSQNFYAQLPIPPGVDVDQARASHRHGILTIHLPKVRGQHGEQVKRIPIHTEAPREKAA